MDCVGCGSGAVIERPDLTAQGYRRFRCRDCDKQFNERSDGVLNRASLPSDIIAFVVFCRLRYRLTLRDLSEIMLLRGFKAHDAADRFCRSHDELRNFLRGRSRHNQYVPAARRRRRFLRQAHIAIGVMQIA
jgi:transposase-like protein